MSYIRSAFALKLWHQGYNYVIHELTYRDWIADLVATGAKRGILEVEIKMTWKDYQADYFKSTKRASTFDLLGKLREGNGLLINKYEWLKTRLHYSWRPTHFVYVAPLELAKRIVDDPNLPISFGVYAYEENTTAEKFKCLKKPKRLVKQTPENRHALLKAMLRRAMNIVSDGYVNDLAGKNYTDDRAYKAGFNEGHNEGFDEGMRFKP